MNNELRRRVVSKRLDRVHQRYSEEQIEEWTAEAEAGYEVEALKNGATDVPGEAPNPRRSPPFV